MIEVSLINSGGVIKFGIVNRKGFDHFFTVKEVETFKGLFCLEVSWGKEMYVPINSEELEYEILRKIYN